MWADRIAGLHLIMNAVFQSFSKIVADAMVIPGFVERAGDLYQNAPIAATFLTGRTLVTCARSYAPGTVLATLYGRRGHSRSSRFE
jgi:hypothetical protein